VIARISDVKTLYITRQAEDPVVMDKRAQAVKKENRTPQIRYLNSGSPLIHYSPDEHN